MDTGSLSGNTLGTWNAKPVTPSKKHSELLSVHGLRVGLRAHSRPKIDRIRAYGDLIMICPKPYSIYLRETLGFRGLGSAFSP